MERLSEKLTREYLLSLSLPEVKELLKERNLTTSGYKLKLIQRLLDFQENKPGVKVRKTQKQSGSYWRNEGKYQELRNTLNDRLIPRYGPAETFEGNLLRVANYAYYRHFNDGDDYYESLRNADRKGLSLKDYTFLLDQDVENNEDEEYDKMMDAVIEEIKRRLKISNKR